MAPLEPWEKVLISQDYAGDPHGDATCSECHGGDQTAGEKDPAHSGLISNPSANERLCIKCHINLNGYSDSLHATQAGYWTAINARSVPENHEVLEGMFGNHCASCHTTCGDCHVSQPNSVGGGLLNAHTFERTPPMTRTCTACHGSRVGSEFLGKHEEIPGDVHFRTARFNCPSCPASAELHSAAEGQEPHRYAGAETPSCESCHTNAPEFNEVPQHTLHEDKLACQVCHSVEYTSCDGCHVAVSETTGNPFFKTDATYMSFYIGLNPLKSEDRPYDYVVLRHVPVTAASYQFYGEGLLPNFNALPTWTYATPHNIQRVTPQNQSCESCHGNPALFLTADKVAPEELEANQSVIVTEPPASYGK